MYQVNKSLFYTDKDNHNLGTDKFKDFNLQALRLQMVDKTIDQVTLFHAHQVLFSFSVFLNTVGPSEIWPSAIIATWFPFRTFKTVVL